MKTNRLHKVWLTIILLTGLSCNLPFVASPQPATGATPGLESVVPPGPASTLEGPATSAPASTPVTHLMRPSDTPSTSGLLVYDVESSGTAPEKRAPGGDSYNINRFERPFLQDMTYDENLDIVTFTLSNDNDWYYVSIELIGFDPNDRLGINYGVELDPNRDGFGDYIVWAHPPYAGWDTANVEVFQDKNHDTGGLSAEKSDAVLKGDGYETLIFGPGIGDTDLAWVRANAGQNATIQFAFKKSLAGPAFMIGVVADAGLKNVGLYDYNDRFKEAEAGSPIKSKQYYPLGSLYALDNTCWEAYNYKPPPDGPQKLCPHDVPKPKKTPSACQPPPGCHLPYGVWYGEPQCYCLWAPT